MSWFLYHRFVVNFLLILFTSFGTCQASTSSSSPVDRNQYIILNKTQIASLDSKTEFDALTATEKLYVHHMSRAAWLGGIIGFFQASAESPYIFLLLQQLFREQTLSQLKSQATNQCKFSPTNWDAFLKYSAGFYALLGNYQTFGIKKILPDFPREQFDCLVAIVASKKSKIKNVRSDSNIDLSSLWTIAGPLMYNFEERYQQQGLKPVGVTAYFSSNCDDEDAKLAHEYMVSKKIEGWNTRIFKTDLDDNRKSFEIRFASVNTSNGTVDGVKLGVLEDFGNNSFQFLRGDYSPILQEVVSELSSAKTYSSNEIEKKVIAGFIQSYKTGSIIDHKNALRLWVTDKGPTIESYTGFMETYQDPTGVSAAYESLVGVVDKEKSARLGNLVSQAEQFLPLLPWPREFEKDVFMKPDFTDLTVITYANGAPPTGINLPDYNDVRQTDGFKNVNLGNIADATADAQPVQYLQKSDADILSKNRGLVSDIHVGLHELLGHGSGKLFTEDQNGSLNFNASAIGNVPPYGHVTTWYRPGETYNSNFGRLGLTMEECRADAVAAYLSIFPQVLSIWDIDSTEANLFTYLVWLEMALEGLQALIDYAPDTDTWGEAHSQGRFAILRVMVEAQVAKVTTIEDTDGQPDLLVTLDRSRIEVEGKKALAAFLTGLEFYRSTGNAKDGQPFYERYTAIKGPNSDPDLLKWQTIAQNRKQPDALLVQPNTYVVVKEEEIDIEFIRPPKLPTIAIKQYAPTSEGMFESFKDRYPELNLEKAIFSLANRDLHNFLI